MKTEAEIRAQIEKMETLVREHEAQKTPPTFAEIQKYYKAQRSIAALKWVLE